MNKVIFIGRTGAGKTTLAQALMGEDIKYHKTQSVERRGYTIDTPGEYAETKTLAGALAVFTYEADVVGLLISANEPYSLFGPNITSMANREVIGIVTGLTKKAQIPIGRSGGWNSRGAREFSELIQKQAREYPNLLHFCKNSTQKQNLDVNFTENN